LDRRVPPARRIASSVVLVAVTGFLLAGVVMAVAFVVATGKDDAGSLGERILLAALGLTYYGPVLLLGFWPVGLPIVAALGCGLAFVPRQPRCLRTHPGVLRAVRVGRAILIGYAVVLAATWLVLVLG
jgi:hypothetical protein